MNRDLIHFASLSALPMFLIVVMLNPAGTFSGIFKTVGARHAISVTDAPFTPNIEADSAGRAAPVVYRGEVPRFAGPAQAADIVPRKAVRPDPPFHDQILRAAEAYDVDSALIRAVIMVESSNNPVAVSRRGAQGLMQLMPVTARSLGVHNPFDPDMNIDGGVRYLKQLLDRFDGDVRLALAAYNAGPRHVRNYGGVPPFNSTRNYIDKVLNYRRRYTGETVPGAFEIAGN